MMRSLPIVTLAAILAAPAFAQTGMPAASQMKRYESLLGKWQGGGPLTDVNQGQNIELDVSIKVEFTKVLGGHFIERKLILQIESAPGPIEVLTYMGWDMLTETHRHFSVSNQGPDDAAELRELHWLGETKWVDFETTEGEQGAMQMRWVHSWDGDALTMKVERLPIGSEAWTLMDLKLERAESLEVGLSNAAFFPAGFPGVPEAFTTAKEMLKDETANAGVWDLEGWAVNEMMPTMKIDAKGTETITPILDGLALRSKLEIELGGMGTYEGLHFVVWNPVSKKINRLMVSNYGEMQHTSMTKTETGAIGTTVGPHAHLQLPKWTVWTTPDASGMSTLDFFAMLKDGKTLHLSGMKLQKRGG